MSDNLDINIVLAPTVAARRMMLCNSLIQSPAVPERRKATLSFLLDCCTLGRWGHPKGATVKRIPISRGLFAEVDDEDFELLSKRTWTAQVRNRGKVYVANFVWNNALKRSVSFFMHREIIKPPKGVRIDHKDGNGLNNTKGNLRICTNSQNMAGFRLPKLNKTPPFRGVRLKRGKFVAAIIVRGRQFWLGTFPNAELAARAYDVAARRYFGEFASPNFP